MFETKYSVGAKFSILNKALKGSSTHLITPSSTEFTTTFGITQRMEGKVLFQVHWGFRMNGNSGTGNIVLSLEKNGVEIATVTGAVWAKFAWGAFWSWDPRQTSIFALL